MIHKNHILPFVAGLIDGGWHSRVMDDIDAYLTKLKIGSSGSILVSTLGLLLMDWRNGKLMKKFTVTCKLNWCSR